MFTCKLKTEKKCLIDKKRNISNASKRGLINSNESIGIIFWKKYPWFIYFHDRRCTYIKYSFWHENKQSLTTLLIFILPKGARLFSCSLNEFLCDVNKESIYFSIRIVFFLPHKCTFSMEINVVFSLSNIKVFLYSY